MDTMQVNESLREVLHLLGEKWVIDILVCTQTPKHFNDILREVKPITNHILSLKLQELIEHELIVHQNDTYVCSNQARELCALLEPLTAWTKNHWNTAPAGI